MQTLSFDEPNELTAADSMTSMHVTGYMCGSAIFAIRLESDLSESSQVQNATKSMPEITKAAKLLKLAYKLDSADQSSQVRGHEAFAQVQSSIYYMRRGRLYTEDHGDLCVIEWSKRVSSPLKNFRRSLLKGGSKEMVSN